MAHHNTDHPGHRLNELEGIAIVIGGMALLVIGGAFFFDGWDARVVCFYVGAVMLLIGAGIWTCGAHPAFFAGKGKTLGDPLRTQYHVPHSP